MIVAGIDGGATQTRVVLASERGTLLGLGVGGPSNYNNVGVDGARTGIRIALEEAWIASGVERTELRAVFMGMAGVVSPSDRGIIRRIAGDLSLAPDNAIDIDHDIRIALAGGLGGQEGIVLIAGTGSSSYGRRTDGRSHRTGWGYLLDDAGSAYVLGLEAIRATVRAADGRGKPTALSEVVRATFGYSHIDEIMGIIYRDRPDITGIAALAAAVIAAAESGDDVANDILEHGARDLAHMVQVVADRLGFDGMRFRVTTVGGLVESSRTYDQRVRRAIQTAMPGATIQAPLLPPVVGAALLALQSAGQNITGELVNAFRQQTNVLFPSRGTETNI
jgi:N-acetylglucosamine kinase-like BadF-type ATPase